MQSRFDGAKVAPGGYHALLGLETYLHQSGLELPMLHLIKLRSSQINACAYCIDMHWKDLRVIGETEQRLYGLDAWRESPYYSDRERAALAWTEAVTRITDGHAPDRVYEEVRPPLQRKRISRPDSGHRDHQRLEPPGHRLARRTRQISARQSTRSKEDRLRRMRTMWRGPALSKVEWRPRPHDCPKEHVGTAAPGCPVERSSTAPTPRFQLEEDLYHVARTCPERSRMGPRPRNRQQLARSAQKHVAYCRRRLAI
jgi:AhpD family alkylhydroperoxidase